MLNFLTTYYKVTEDNKEILRQLLIDEDIRNYAGDPVDLDSYLQVGHVIGNDGHISNNSKETGYWIKTSYLTGRQYRKVTTNVAQLMNVD